MPDPTTPSGGREATTPQQALVRALLRALEAAMPLATDAAHTALNCDGDDGAEQAVIQQMRRAIASAHNFLGGRPAPRTDFDEGRRPSGDLCWNCGTPIETAELCEECAEGNDPFVSSKYRDRP